MKDTLKKIISSSLIELWRDKLKVVVNFSGLTSKLGSRFALRFNSLIKNESGASIVIALGITALLIGLSLTYIITTQTEKKASINFNNLKMSKMFAESGLRRCLASMQVYSAETDFDLGTICSHKVIADQASDSEPYFADLNTELPTMVNNVSYYEWPAGYNASDPDAVTWIYIKDGNKMIGRIAYAVVPDKGKLDPSVVVDSGGNGVPFTEGDIYTLVKPDGSKITGRPGQYTQELYLNSLSSWFENDSAVAMSADNATPNVGKLIHNTRWQDFSEIFTNLSINNSDIEDSFRKVFSLYSPKDPEAFWVDLSDNQYKESSEMFHRFDLTRNNWNDFDVDSIVANSIVPFNEDYSEDAVTVLPWIKNWKHPGTDTLSDTMSRQIAANLIDYCDTDTEATTDDEDNPTYVGLERCTYINEVHIKYTGETRQGTWSFSIGPFVITGPSYTCQVKVLPTVELVNMYNASLNTVSNVSFSYSYQWIFEIWYSFDFLFWHFEDSLPVVRNISDSINTDITINSSAEYIYDSSGEIDISPSNNIVSVPSPLGDIFGYKSYILNFKISDLKIKETDRVTAELYDYSYVLNSDEYPASGLTLIDEDTPSNTEGYLYFDAQIDDPRQNLYSENWTIANFSSSDINSNIGSLNSGVCNPDPDDGNSDNEDGAVNPGDVSTAFIRNGSMKSPWELGFIHRAAPWQTINLKKYSSSEGNNILSGGNKYSDGDANILDQIKMSPETEVYGKINLNTDISDVLKVLYQGIYVGSDISSSLGPGDQTGASEVGESEALELVSLTLASNGINGGSVFDTRSQIVRDGAVDELTNVLITKQTTDATQEEIIGKFINLTKAAQPNIFHVICLGESIKDVGGTRVDNNGTPIDTQFGTFDIGADEVLSSYKIMAVVKLDSSNNKGTILRFYILTN